MFLRVVLITLVSGFLVQTATSAPRLSAVVVHADSADAALSVHLDTDGLNVVAFNLVFNSVSTCMDPVGVQLGSDAIAAGLDPQSVGGGWGGSSPAQPTPPPFDQFVEGQSLTPQHPIAGLVGSGLEIMQILFHCLGVPAECPLRWDPADYAPGGQMQLELADGTIVLPDQIEFVAPPSVDCAMIVPAEPQTWSRLKILYRDPGPNTR
jgi:hypothetical protein